MSFPKSLLAIFLCVALAVPMFGQAGSLQMDNGHGFVYRLTRNYRPREVHGVSFADSQRIDALMRAGNIYLSLRDAIALALENNLDIESSRYAPQLALADLQRAAAGQLLRNVSTNITSGPSSASLNVLAGASAVNGGQGGATVNNTNTGVLSGLSVQLAGSTIPNMDPTLYVAGGAYHSTQILTSTTFTGTSALVSNYRSMIFGVQQNLWNGTQIQLGLSNILNYNQNATTAIFNPYDSGSLGLTITQPLLNGFGVALNQRSYRKAKNNLKANDLQFKNQVITTVAGVVNLYWDLVTFDDELKIKQQTLDLDTKLYEDNKRRAELGAIAPIDIIQAEADMKAAQQDVITQESQVLQQEMILKNYITRSGMDTPAIAAARIVPTDHIVVPEKEEVIPVQELMAEAIQSRPEVEQNQINLENARLDLKGVRNNLLPTLSATASFSNAGQGGAITNVPQPLVGENGVVTYQKLTAAQVDQQLIGGYGTVLGQIFGRDFPNYSVGLTLTMPLRNRSAQADLITNELTYRQAQIQDKELRNNIRLNVLNAFTAMRNARAAWETSVVARKLYDQTLAGTRRKYELGTATILDVVIAQRDDTTRQLSEADALDQYERARTNLDQTLGKTLDTYDVNLEEAKKGVVSREPDLIPPAQKPPAPNRNLKQ
ncbi:MAG TPA: TolC family protein [Bryobacteraceae bacterium]|nr:TolC family protein [Bryobacteraceae bacterium]